MRRPALCCRVLIDIKKSLKAGAFSQHSDKSFSSLFLVPSIYHGKFQTFLGGCCTIFTVYNI
jgi:hypothetical protein